MSYAKALKEAGWDVSVDREKEYAFCDSVARAIRVAREGGATPIRVVIDKERKALLEKECVVPSPEGMTYRGVKINTRKDLGDAIIVVADGAHLLGSTYYVDLKTGPLEESAGYPRRRIEWTAGYTVSDRSTMESRRELPPVTWRRLTPAELLERETVKVEAPAPAPQDEFDELVIKVSRRKAGG